MGNVIRLRRGTDKEIAAAIAQVARLQALYQNGLGDDGTELTDDAALRLLVHASRLLRRLRQHHLLSPLEVEQRLHDYREAHGIPHP